MIEKILRSLIYKEDSEIENVRENILKIKSFSFIPKKRIDLDILKLVFKEFALDGVYSFKMMKVYFEDKENSLSYLDRLKKIEREELFTKNDFIKLTRDYLEIVRKDTYKDVLIEAIDISTNLTKSQKDLSGVDDSINFLIPKLIDFNQAKGVKKTRGSITKEGGEVKEDYLFTKNNPGNVYGCLTGITSIDEVTLGIRKSDFWVIAAFPGQLKTSFMSTVAYNSMVFGAKNVVFYSLEMEYSVVRRIFYCIHSNHPRFAKIHPPLEYNRVKQGILTEKEENFYFNHVINDFENNPEYGTLRLVQPSSEVTINDIRCESELMHSEEEIHLIVVDYLMRLAIERGKRTGDRKDNYNQVIRDFKNMALTFNKGEGVATLTGHQINRQGYDEAKKNKGVYEIRALSEANAIEKEADVIFTSFFAEEFKANNETKISMLKNRDGESSIPFTAFVDMKHRYIANAAQETDIFDENITSVGI